MAKKTLSDEAIKIMISLKMNMLTELSKSDSCRAEVKVKCLYLLNKAFKKTEKQLKLNINESSNNEISAEL